jgi:hypothetical protein
LDGLSRQFFIFIQRLAVNVIIICILDDKKERK